MRTSIHWYQFAMRCSCRSGSFHRPLTREDLGASPDASGAPASAGHVPTSGNDVMPRSARWYLAVLLLALPRLLAGQEADIITGRVVGEDEQPVVGARVSAQSVETEITRAVLTDARGRYLIHFPDGGGRYVLTVSTLGMADAVSMVTRQGDEE